MLRSISISSGILPIIFFCLFLKRNKERGLWVIFFYCLLSFLTDNLYDLIKVPHFYVFSAFTIAEYSLFTIFLYLSFQGKVFKILLLLGSLVFYCFATSSILRKNVLDFDSVPASVESILLIIYCIIFLYEQINDSQISFIYYSKRFWIIIAFFIYFSSTLFLFIYAANLTPGQHKNYWGINFIFNILKNVLFSVSFMIKEQHKNNHSLENPAPL